ncbi:MAG: magnesium transporter [Candidatus Thermoplasmatota archaeon]|nr:magnesium transporter [Candidatus Thermoplasmatota archaeon]
MLAKGVMKQSLPLLIICGIGGILTGNTLGAMITLFQKIPGLLVVIPAVIALRGNINTALGSRLGSAYHLGVIDAEHMWNNELKQNIIGSLFLSFFVSILIAILAYGSSILLNIYPDPLVLILIVILAGSLSGIILAVLTIGIIFIVFKRGYDPDNITGPALATFGDIITILCIFGSAILIGGIT